MSPSVPQTWTVGRLLQWTTQYLRRRGSTSPRLDAEVLLAHALHCARVDLYTRWDEVPQEEQRAVFRRLVQQRSQGVPVAYLVGEKEFFSLPFYVSPAVLIPRPETEFLLAALLDALRDMEHQQRVWIADVGTGSGVLAICAARSLPQAQVAAIDVSAQALEVARRNALRHQVDRRVHLVQADLLEPFAPESFHCVMSNPPYRTCQEFEESALELKHEPRVALVAGPEGTEVIAPLVKQAHRCLVRQGVFLCEVSPMIHSRVLELFDPQAWERPQTVKDLARLPRVVIAVKR